LISSSKIHTVRLPRCRRPASYSGQFVVLYDFLTYFAWLRLKAVIAESELGEFAGTVVRAQKLCTKTAGKTKHTVHARSDCRTGAADTVDTESNLIAGAGR